MSTLAVGGGLFVDMSVMDYSVFFFGEATVATKKRYVLEFPDTDELVDFRGTGFRYGKDGVPSGGDLEGFTFYQQGARTFQIGGVDISVKAFVSAAETTSTADDLKITGQMFSGNDKIAGGALADGLMGFKGNDAIHGAGGADVLMGGAGADRFVYLSAAESNTAAADSILDFSHAQKDRIDISAIGDFTFSGEGALTGKAGELVYSHTDGNTFVAADSNGDATADFLIGLKGTIDLVGGDFIL